VMIPVLLAAATGICMAKSPCAPAFAAPAGDCNRIRTTGAALCATPAPLFSQHGGFAARHAARCSFGPHLPLRAAAGEAWGWRDDTVEYGGTPCKVGKFEEQEGRSMPFSRT
jgi:hypothetical protein